MRARIINLFNKILLNDEQYARKIGVTIGHSCSIATRNFGSEPYLITIGDYVQITNDVKFFTHGGGWIFRRTHPSFDTFGKITIGNNIYIGNNAILLPGVTIGDNVIIAASAIITKSVPAGSIVAGNPAKVIGSTNEYLMKMLPYNVNTKHLSKNKKRNFLLSLPDEKFVRK